MAQRYGALGERLFGNEREKVRRFAPVASVPLEQMNAVDRGSGNYSVPRLSCSRSIETNSALKFPLPNDRLPFR